MITLKFVDHKDENRYAVYSCAWYNVDMYRTDGEPIEGFNYQKQVKMFRHYQDDDPQHEYVGPTHPYRICYVMNDMGKTIDVIR